MSFFRRIFSAARLATGAQFRTGGRSATAAFPQRAAVANRVARPHQQPYGKIRAVGSLLPTAGELTPTETAVYDRETIFATSSWIHEWAYDGPRQSLYLRTKKGYTYRLDTVSFATVMGFYRSDSPGRYFNWHLKGRYPGAKGVMLPPQLYRNVVTALD